MLYGAQGKRDEARQQYQQALAIDSSAPVAANNLAYLHAEQGENLDEALQLAQTARQALPESPDVADTLGWVYVKRGLPASALAPLREAAGREPTNAEFQYHLGHAYMKNGDFRQAREAFEAGLKLNPRSPSATEAQVALKQLVTMGA
jgi:Flp pilus assembly protein TadD